MPAGKGRWCVARKHAVGNVYPLNDTASGGNTMAEPGTFDHQPVVAQMAAIDRAMRAYWEADDWLRLQNQRRPGWWLAGSWSKGTETRTQG